MFADACVCKKIELCELRGYFPPLPLTESHPLLGRGDRTRRVVPKSARLLQDGSPRAGARRRIAEQLRLAWTLWQHIILAKKELLAWQRACPSERARLALRASARVTGENDSGQLLAIRPFFWHNTCPGERHTSCARRREGARREWPAAHVTNEQVSEQSATLKTCLQTDKTLIFGTTLRVSLFIYFFLIVTIMLFCTSYRCCNYANCAI